jgi:hypothetical protein
LTNYGPITPAADFSPGSRMSLCSLPMVYATGQFEERDAAVVDAAGHVQTVRARQKLVSKLPIAPSVSCCHMIRQPKVRSVLQISGFRQPLLVHSCSRPRPRL